MAEVRGSNPLSSTNKNNELDRRRGIFKKFPFEFPSYNCMFKEHASKFCLSRLSQKAIL
jgi:hypothetical protein